MSAEPPESVSLFATSPDFDPSTCEIVVCVPTFKRPAMLEDALRSLAAQRTSRPFAVMVVENDGGALAGASHAAKLMREGLVPGLIIVERRQGNCKAYNAGWRYAVTRLPKMRLLLGIDDDEVAEPDWLEAHLAAAESHGGDMQAGVVVPHFEDASMAWLKDHPIFRSHYDRSGPVPLLYGSANYLIRREALDMMPFPYLDESFDYSGGGDSDFFRRAAERGVRFRWVQEAVVHEIVPHRRSQRDWIVARGFRNGILSTLIARKAATGATGRLRIMLKSAALLAASPLRAAVMAARTRSLLIGFYPVQVALGRWMAEFGMTREQYRKPEAN